MTAIPAAHAEPIPLPCPRCGYDLRGSPSSVCPECGEAFDADALATTAAIPWQSRREIGRVRAFRRTVWLALRHPARLARQASRPVDYPDARRFQLVCVSLAWLTLAPPAAWGTWTGLRMIAAAANAAKSATAGLIGSVNAPPAMTTAGLLADGGIVAAAVVGLFVFLLTATGVASYFFHPRDRDVKLQNRAIALSYYAAAPLALLPALAVLVFGYVLLTAATGAPTMAKYPAIFLILGTYGVVCALLILFVPVNLLALPLIFLGRGTRASAGRVALCGLTILLVAWPVLFVAFVVGPLVLTFYVQFVWHLLA